MQELCENICSGGLAMILDDNLAGLIMLGIFGLMTYCYQFGKFIGQYGRKPKCDECHKH